MQLWKKNAFSLKINSPTVALSSGMLPSVGAVTQWGEMGKSMFCQLNLAIQCFFAPPFPFSLLYFPFFQQFLHPIKKTKNKNREPTKPPAYLYPS